MAQTTSQQAGHHVVMVSDASGVKGLAVTGYTALKHASRPLSLWAVVDGIPEESRRGLAECWSRAGNLAGVQFLPFGRLPIWFSASHYSRATYVRLVLTSILPPHVDRYLYLDIDLLVGRDVVELLATDLGDCPIGMVLNSGMDETACGYVRDRLGLDPDDYYNGGVMLVDAAAFRRHDHEAGLLERCRRMPATWFADQDVVNTHFCGRIRRLDPCWNLRARGLPLDGRILHFAGGAKPWDKEPRPDSRIGDIAWHDWYGQSGFVPPPSGSLWKASRKVTQRILAKSLRYYLRLKKRVP
jgi:lipopolysaccharide biosynthesis glycosyltransferase